MRTRAPNPEAARGAIHAFLEALGYEVSGELERTPARTAELWIDRLTAAESRSLADIVRDGVCAGRGDAPVSVLDIGVHMICPHHLTVAMGRAHVAYTPRGRILGFGAVADLVEVATGRMVLQEDATSAIAQALVSELGAAAAVACVQATHPCHNVLHPRSNEAQALTWASAGEAEEAERLRTLLLAGLGHGAPRS
jgi:GTP cyclohydrolase IA